MTGDVLGAGFSDTREVAVVVMLVAAVASAIALAVENRGGWRWRDR